MYLVVGAVCPAHRLLLLLKMSGRTTHTHSHTHTHTHTAKRMWVDFSWAGLRKDATAAEYKKKHPDNQPRRIQVHYQIANHSLIYFKLPLVLKAGADRTIRMCQNLGTTDSFFLMFLFPDLNGKFGCPMKLVQSRLCIRN